MKAGMGSVGSPKLFADLAARISASQAGAASKRRLEKGSLFSSLKLGSIHRTCDA